jgi:hypothetical protein
MPSQVSNPGPGASGLQPKVESRNNSMIPRMLKFFYGVGLFCAVVYLLLCSNALTLIEGENLDGSSSETWRSGLAAAVVFALCQIVSYLVFRRRIALTVSIGMACCVVCWHWLSYSSFGFVWERHNPDGTFPLTWRSDLVMLGFVTSFIAVSLLIRDMVNRLRGPCRVTVPANKNI